MVQPATIMRGMKVEDRLREYLKDFPNASFNGYQIFSGDKEITKEIFAKVKATLPPPPGEEGEPIKEEAPKRLLKFKMASTKESATESEKPQPEPPTNPAPLPEPELQLQTEPAKEDITDMKKAAKKKITTAKEAPKKEDKRAGLNPDSQRVYDWLTKNVKPGDPIPTRGDYVEASGDKKVSQSTYQNMKLKLTREREGVKRMPKGVPNRTKGRSNGRVTASFDLGSSNRFRIIHTIEGVKADDKGIEFFKKHFAAVVRGFMDLEPEEPVAVEYVQLINPDRLEIRQKI